MPENTEKEYKFYKLDINLEEFIEQTEGAAKRTRWTMIVLVLASVLIGIGFYNTTPFSFAPEGLSSLSKFENQPINNLAEEKGQTMPLLDSYFGENDFSDTKFEKHFYTRFRDVYNPRQEGYSTGLERFICDGIYAKKDSADTPEKYIYDNLNPATRELLKECEKDESLAFPKDPVKFNYLTTDLNKILTDKYLYNEKRFPDSIIKLEETRRLLNEWKEAKKATANQSNPPPVVSAQNLATTAKSTSKPKKQQSLPLPTPSPVPSPTPENEAILSSKAREVDIVRLNRLLLEAAFPNEINPSADIIPSRESRIAREIATHIAFDENVRYVNIPFFDTSIEVNDLGAFGGIALIIILLLLRFSLSREIKNLNIAFRQSFYKDELAAFYHQLAMRLVLIVPKMESESVNQTLSAGAKYICFLPLLILTAGVAYDWYSIKILGLYKADEVLPHLLIEDVCVAIVAYLSLRCLERLTHIDEIWEDYHTIWEHYFNDGRESHDILLSKEQADLMLPKEKEAEKELDWELVSAIQRRVHNKSKGGRFDNFGRVLRFWGRLWIGRLLTLKNLSRLMPIKPLRKLVEWISDQVWRLITKWHIETKNEKTASNE